MPRKAPHVDFEKAMNRLQEIVAALDAPELRLADSVTLYQEGIDLLEQCAQELSGVQKQLKELRKRSEGIFELVDVQE
jgi:exodeoxyribonuclease VII small subunit